jgi:thioredoxin 1
MTSKTKTIILAAMVLLGAFGYWSLFHTGSESQSVSQDIPKSDPESVLTSGRVAMIDLGAEECIPCKMMAPILKDLKQVYHGRADIIFIDVAKNRQAAQKYGIRAIPTQIFFNEKGEEVSRHIGFMDRDTIIKTLSGLGVAPPETGSGSR